MATSTKTLIQNAAVKLDTGGLSSPVPIGATFDNVVDTRIGKGNYNVAQLFDAVMDFFQTADFIYYGAEKPDNTHVRLWIDTSKSNQ